MADIIYKGKVIKGVHGVAFPSANGGEAVFGEGGSSVDVEALSVTANGEYTAPTGKAYSPVTVNVPWNWMGENVELVDGEIWSVNKKLKDTDYATWTPSTTAIDLVTSAYIPDITVDLGNYEYIIHWTFESYFVYAAGTPQNTMVNRFVREDFIALFKRPYNYDALTQQLYNGNTGGAIATSMVMDYFASNGSRSINTSAGSSGVFVRSVSTPSMFGGVTSDITTVKIQNPRIGAACNAATFSTASAAAVDQNNSGFIAKGELYRTSIGGMMRKVTEMAVNHYFNPLT